MPQWQTRDEKFFKYHGENPHVYDLYLKYAEQVREKGYKNYSIYTIMHRVRWHVNVETRDNDGFKMNNNYAGRYARLIELRNPEFKGFFRNRRLKYDSVLEKKER